MATTKEMAERQAAEMLTVAAVYDLPCRVWVECDFDDSYRARLEACGPVSPKAMLQLIYLGADVHDFPDECARLSLETQEILSEQSEFVERTQETVAESGTIDLTRYQDLKLRRVG